MNLPFVFSRFQNAYEPSLRSVCNRAIWRYSSTSSLEMSKSVLIWLVLDFWYSQLCKVSVSVKFCVCLSGWTEKLRNVLTRVTVMNFAWWSLTERYPFIPLSVDLDFISKSFGVRQLKLKIVFHSKFLPKKFVWLIIWMHEVDHTTNAMFWLWRLMERR